MTDIVQTAEMPTQIVERGHEYAVYRQTNNRELYIALLDPCGFILEDSFYNERQSENDAAKKERAKRRAIRAELMNIERQARSA